MVVGITIMKTNKIGHFVCGVLATYGLVVACGNMKKSASKENNDDNSCLGKLFDCNKKNAPTKTFKRKKK